MASGERKPGGALLFLRFISAALLVYGAVGVAINLRLLPLIIEGLRGWSGTQPDQGAPANLDWLGLLQAHYDAVPWLPWAAWLAGIALLALGRTTARREEPVSLLEPHARWLVPALLVLLVLVAGYARMAELWPQDYGLTQFPYDDEGVYAGTSQLFLQGILPYRDYFFAHPPLAAISYAPAMAYHFTQWGSPTSFMIARYLSVAYSLATLVILFLIGARLAGPWAGALAGLLWALDGRVVEINRKIMLDGPMVLLSCAGLLLYLWVRPGLAGEKAVRRPLIVLGLAGACAALSALTKIAGVACLVAILADMAWLALERRRAGRGDGPPRFMTQLGSILGGAAIAAVVVLTPFVLQAPSQFVRDVFFFQLLRPSDGLIDIPARVADLSAAGQLWPLATSLTLILAAFGVIVLSLSAWSTANIGPWRVVVLWMFFSVLLFTYSRSFYSHYYIQLAAPLCLLGAGVTLLPGLVRRTQSGAQAFRLALRFAPLVAVTLVVLPLAWVEWNGITKRHEDRIFEIVARYVNDAVPPGTPVLSTDEQFNFLAARPPSRTGTGYLVDSYGHMIFLGLQLDSRSWSDLWSAALSGEHSNDVYAVMQRPTAQADFLMRASRVSLIVIHQKGVPRLTHQTLAAIEAESTVRERQARYTIYQLKAQGLGK
jgi:hypothetical protein